MTGNSDIIVIGAGPAGSLTALLLARAGRRVLLLEKAKFPRPKVCGNCFNPRIAALLDRHGLGAGYAELPHQPIEELQIEAQGRPFHRQTLATHSFRAIDRAVFDHWLAGEARAAGVEFIDNAGVHAVSEDGTVETDRGSRQGRYVIGADGRNSLVAQRIAPLRRTPCRRVGWQGILSGLPPSAMLRLNLFAEGYYGLVHLPEGRANLSMVLDARSGIDPETLLKRYLPEARLEECRTVAPISRTDSVPVRNPFWLVGDAARVVEPFTGEGIYFALASAERATDILNRNWHRTADQTAPLYHLAHDNLYNDEIEVNRFTLHLLRNSFLRRAAPLLRHFPSLIPGLVARVLAA